MSFREWISKVGIVLRGRPYSTKGHEYLDQIIDDVHPDQSVEKAAQVGISTLVALKSIYVAEHMGKVVIYYFQNDGQVSDFSNARVNPIIEASPYLESRVGSTKNVGLKQIGPGHLYFRGLFTKGKVKSVDADFIILDELDEAKPANVAFAMDRLMHSDLQWKFALSQPSLPGYGVDKEFEETDKHFWHIICPACGKRNCLENHFPANFIPIASKNRRSFPDGATHYRGCRFCGAKLDMSKGEWIAAHPSRFRRGYHLSQLFSQIVAIGYPNFATKIMAEHELARKSQNRLARFVISVLGFPFSGGNARINDELLDFCEGEHALSTEGEYGCFMGVDQGDTLSIAIGMLSGGRLYWVWFEETDDWSRLDMLMSKYGVHYCVIDAQPNKQPAKAFAAKHPGRVAIQYFGAKELQQKKELHEGKVEVDAINVDRTTSIDGMIDRIEWRELVMPARSKCTDHGLRVIEDVRRHLKNLVAKNEEGANGIVRRVYITGVENHYGMAMNSAVIAAYELGIKAPSPMVLPVFRQIGNA